MKLPKLFLILSIVCIALGVSSIVTGVVLSFYGYKKLVDLFFGLGSVLGVGALVLLVLRLINSPEISNANREHQPRVVVKVVDVKDLPKTKEEKLFEQYEDLYKKGLISKEDLELKREELLKK